MAKTLVQSKAQLPEVHPGDIVRVHQKIKEGEKERVQVFEGIVLKTHGRVGPSATFTVRKIASGVGVERTYLLQSPNIVKIEFKKGSEVRRAKLYYLRALSGKALKMKDKKLDRDVWELIAADSTEGEPTEAVLAEAVEAAKEQVAVTEPITEAMVSEEPIAESGSSDTVEGEPSNEQPKTGEQSGS